MFQLLLAICSCETLCKHEVEQIFIVGEKAENGKFMDIKSVRLPLFRRFQKAREYFQSEAFLVGKECEFDHV